MYPQEQEYNPPSHEDQEVYSQYIDKKRDTPPLYGGFFYYGGWASLVGKEIIGSK